MFSHLDPGTQTQLVLAVIGVLTSMATLLAAAATFLKSKLNGQKLDDNTNMTKEIHIATNGRLQTLVDAMIQAATNAKTAEQAAKAHADKSEASAKQILSNQQAASTSKEAI
jgi:Na+-transporting NADH:ubiquinone oxidoreductase subunit NqrC